MTVSPAFITVMVVAALAMTTLAPLVLVALLVRDWKRGQLW